MSATTLHKQTAAVLTIEQKLGRACEIVKRALAQIDPNAVLTFSQAHEIERLQARNLALGFILAHVETAQKAALREFARLQASDVWVDPKAIETVRTCLAEDDRDNGGGSG